MIVSYLNAGYVLNIREEPSTDAEIIGTMLPGQSASAEPAGDEWYALDGGGYVMAEYVQEVGGASPEPSDGAACEDTACMQDGSEGPGDDGADDPACEEAEDIGVLSEMTAAELRKLAKDSGIKVSSKANKSEIIAAILNG